MAEETESQNSETPEDDSATVADESAIDSAEEPSIEEQLAQAIQERDAQTDRALRAQAELENVRRRLIREADQIKQFAVAPLAAELLPLLDNLQRGITAGESTGNIEELLNGLQMVSKSFEESFGRFGVQKIPTMNEQFDPNKHEALQQVPSPDHEPMQIVQEVETGWQMHDRVIRPSKVIVSSGPPAE